MWCVFAGSCWILGRAWFHCRCVDLGELVSINVLWCSKVLELSLLPLTFSPSLIVTSRLLHPYNIEDKTPGFIGETILHSQDHPERFTQLYREEKREEEDRGDQEEKRGSQMGERAV